MQLYTVYLYLQTVLHVSGGISIHQQELISLHLQYLALMGPLLLPVVSVTFTTGRWWVEIPPETRREVEKFADINKMYIVASCWIIIDTHLFLR